MVMGPNGGANCGRIQMGVQIVSPGKKSCREMREICQIVASNLNKGCK